MPTDAIHKPRYRVRLEPAQIEGGYCAVTFTVAASTEDEFMNEINCVLREIGVLPNQNLAWRVEETVKVES